MPRPVRRASRVRGSAGERARVAVGVAFALNGFAFASWISRTPALRQTLDLDASQLGLLLLCVSGGAVGALPGSGPLVQRIGAARAVAGAAVAVGMGLIVLAAGLDAADAALAGAGLVVVGAGTSVWDVAMNVAGAAVERDLDRTLLPRFHAGFSLGTVAGALAGAAAAALARPVQAQLVGTAGVVVAATAVAARRFLPTAPAAGRGGTVRGAWSERRTQLLGILVLAFAFAEGTANDWLTLALVDGHGASPAAGAVGFAIFMAAMTAARITGSVALHRWGRVAVLRGAALLTAGGLLAVVYGPSLPWAAAGAIGWGVGVALGFPVGVSAAADDPARAALRISVVSSIGYTAFLAGPPMLGLLAQRVGVLDALLAVLAALAAILVTAPASRSPAPVPAGTGHG